MNLKALQLRLAELKNKQKKSMESLDSLTDAAAQDALLTEMEADQAEIEKVTKSIATLTAASANDEGDNTKAAGAGVGAPALGVEGQESFKSIAVAAKSSELKNYSGERADERAYLTGLWFAGTVMGKSWAKQKLADLAAKFTDAQIQATNQNETVDADGGYLVPKQIAVEIDRVAARQSIYQRDARTINMTTNETEVITNDHGLKMAFVDELQAGPLSKLKFGKYSMEAKKLLGFVAVSSEFNEDTTTDLGDLMTGEFGAAKADISDATGFFADGSATFKGLIGLIPAILGLNGTPDNIGSVLVKAVAANKGWDDITRADMVALANRVAAKYRRGGNEGLKWYTTQEFYLSVMVRIIEQGVFTIGDIQRGTAVNGTQFLGFPVEFIPTFEAPDFNTYGLPTTYATGQVPVLFGNLSKVSVYGNRKDLTIAKSTEALFHLDGILYRARTRFAVKQIPDALGVANATAGLRKQGAIAALYVKNA